MKTIIFKNGQSVNVTGEAGKYWLCGELRVRKLNKSIAEVRELPDEKPNKKTSRKKKDAEVEADGERVG